MYNIDFISKENLKEHIKNTIATYDQTLNGIDLRKFNINEFMPSGSAVNDPVNLILILLIL